MQSKAVKRVVNIQIEMSIDEAKTILKAIGKKSESADTQYYGSSEAAKTMYLLFEALDAAVK